MLVGFLTALQSGEISAIEAFLAEDARSWADGGGKVKASLRCVVGRTNSAKLFLGLIARGSTDGLRPELGEINGWPAALFWRGDELAVTLTIETDGARIHAIHVMLNPDKLRHTQQQLTRAS
jgi:RNA polymerase sigma-70 factor (ECF subfamily)